MTAAEERAERLAAEPMRDVNPPSGVFRGTIRSIKDIIDRRQLLFLLVRREIKAKYKDSILGLLWSLVRPLIQLLIYVLVIGQFLGAARGTPNFAIFVYTGLAGWGVFQEIVSGGTMSIVNNTGIIKKIHLPREIFPLSTVGSALFNFLIQLAILTIAVLFTSGFNTSVNFLHFPAGILVAVVWGTALALILSAVNVYLRDTQYLVEVALMIGFWLSPIVYPWSMVQQWAMNNGTFGAVASEIYLANPVTLAVMGMQRVAWQCPPDWPYPAHLGLRLIIALIVGLVFLFLAQRIFNRMQRNFAQEI